MTLVFVPVDPAGLRAWATSGRLAPAVHAFADTPGLRDAFGLTDAEDAERVALLAASVAALVRHGVRLVAVAEAPIRLLPGGDADFGEVVAGELSWTAVTSLFADEPGLDAAPAATAASGAELAQAWEFDEVAALVAEADLLWYSASEWERLAD